MKIGIIGFTGRGTELGRRIFRAFQALGADCRFAVPGHFLTGELRREGVEDFKTRGLEAWAGEMFAQKRSLVFVGAMGIAVRAIAPWIRDKLEDPAVVVLDEGGRFVIPVLSGHVGGANELARQLAGLVGAEPVITTATDVNGLFAVDVFAARNGLQIFGREEARAVSMELLAGGRPGFLSDFPVRAADGGDWLPEGCDSQPAGINIRITVRKPEKNGDLYLIPRCVSVGIGCRRNTPLELLEKQLDQALNQAGIGLCSLECIASVDRKAEEPGLKELAAKLGLPFYTYSPQQLEEIPGEFQESEFVRETVGTGNVCERAAVAAGGGRLILPKQAENGITLALALRQPRLWGTGW